MSLSGGEAIGSFECLPQRGRLVRQTRQLGRLDHGEIVCWKLYIEPVVAVGEMNAHDCLPGWRLWVATVWA